MDTEGQTCNEVLNTPFRAPKEAVGAQNNVLRGDSRRFKIPNLRKRKEIFVVEALEGATITLRDAALGDNRIQTRSGKESVIESFQAITTLRMNSFEVLKIPAR